MKWTLSWFRYNVVFRYLLSVRRVQSELQHCWALQMQRKHLKSNQTDAVKWRLRNHMAFLVDNLQYYLQVTTWIIYLAASQFAYYTHVVRTHAFPLLLFRWMFWSPSFRSSYNRSTPHETLRAFDWPMTISSAISLHSLSFCSSLWVSITNLSLCQYPRLCSAFGLILFLSQVFHCLNEILDLCHNFCSLVSQNLGPLDERGAAQLDILVKVALLVWIDFGIIPNARLYLWKPISASWGGKKIMFW